VQLRSIDFIEQNGEAAISSATVTMNREEIAYLAKLLGGMNDVQANEVMPGGGVTSNGIYECLTGDVINPYHENGVDDLVQSLRGAAT
jgi:hypothetical protein